MIFYDEIGQAFPSQLFHITKLASSIILCVLLSPSNIRKAEELLRIDKEDQSINRESIKGISLSLSLSLSGYL